MAKYARLNNTNELQEVIERFERPENIAHKNVFWFPYVEVKPDFNASTQVREATIDTFDGETYTRTYPVRDKTAQELSDELDTTRNNMAQRLQDEENILRAFMLLVLDEFNAHADMLNAIKVAARDATSLANFQTRMNAITAYPTRTEEQLRTAIRNKLGL